jgi:histidinol-phosphate/aromatic aminotransferase/cobyric acid decarboxylase-like protein
MLEMNEKINLEKFANYMIRRNFLIKTLTGKTGIPEGNFLRIAVKTKEENREFVEEMQNFLSVTTSDPQSS